jgi:hypothetical protein
MKQQKGKKKNPQFGFKWGKKDKCSNLCHQEHAAD